MEKVILSINELFSGIGCQRRGIENTGLFDVNIVNTSEISKDAVLSYAAIHCGLTEDLVNSYEYYPSENEMAKQLTDINLGYIPEKDKYYDWYKLARMKNKTKIRKYWLANKLSKNIGDISKVDRLKYADLWTLSSPCFVEGTLVLTEDGYKEIQELKVGERVLTHNNKWQKVLNVMTNEADHLYNVQTMPSEHIHCTGNHPFYVRRKHNKQESKTSKRYREFDQPQWIEAKDLSRDYYVGTAINKIEKVPSWEGIDKKDKLGHERHENRLLEHMDNSNFWYIIGRFIGDGWVRPNNGIIICGNEQEIYQITPYLERLSFNYNVTNERTVKKLHIPFQEIGVFCEQFGRGAANKHLTKDVLDLPVNLLKSFLDGYFDSYGSYTKGLYKATSVSRRLIYEIAQCIMKVYHRPVSIYFTLRPKTCVIEGRIVNQKDKYSLTFKKSNDPQDKAFYEDGYIWSPINNVFKEEYDGLTYNLEVENDNSYMIQNVIVHNCTDISIAGKLKGLNPDSGTRSSLLWENIRLLKNAKEDCTLPKYLLLENVKNLVNKQFINDFKTLLSIFDDLGYNCYWKVLNAKDAGVPQNRERVFMIGIRKDIDTCKFEFPKTFDNGIRLKHILEEKVDEKYYINSENAKKLIENLMKNKDFVERERERLLTSQSITQDSEKFQTAYQQEQIGEFLIENKKEPALLKNYATDFCKKIEYCSTIEARDYKGFGKQAMTGVIEVEK